MGSSVVVSAQAGSIMNGEGDLRRARLRLGSVQPGTRAIVLISVSNRSYSLSILAAPEETKVYSRDVIQPSTGSIQC